MRGRAFAFAGLGGGATGAALPAAAAARTLAVEPRVDVAFAEAPLPADAHRGNLAGLDQPVHRAQIDLKVFEDFFGREKRFVNHAFNVLDARHRRARGAPREARRSALRRLPRGMAALIRPS